MSWARGVIAEHGVELPDGMVAVYGSQADISAACGHARNDGRVYAYLRDLAAGGVALCERGVVLFNPERLDAMERAVVVRRLTPRAMEVAGVLSHQFGRPAADGTVTLELTGDSGGEAQTSPRLSDIGEALGVNRSSAHRHVSALRSHGYLAGGRRGGGPLRLVPDAGPQPGQVLWQLVNAQAELVNLLSLAHTLRDEQQGLNELIGAGEATSESQDIALSQLAQTQASLIDAFSRAHSVRDEIDTIYQLLDGPAQSAPSAPSLRADKSAQLGADGADCGAEQEEKIREDVQNSSLFFSKQGAEGADCGAEQKARTAARTPDAGIPEQQADGPQGPRGWEVSDLPLLCADLAEACQARALQGANNWPGLARALAAYTKDQVVAAQGTLANDVRSKRPIMNPFGLLAKVAAPDHPQHACYFLPERAQPQLRRPSPIDQPDEAGSTEEDLDIEAAQAVAALEADERHEDLAALDEYALAHDYRFMPRVFEGLSAASRLQARAGAWRSLNPSSSPDLHDQGKET